MSKKTVTYFMCDRCGKLFRNDPGLKTVRYKDGDYHFRYEVEYDLCPDCFSDYTRFIKGAKVVDE